MTKDTTKPTEMPVLIQTLLVLLNAHASNYKQKRTFRRVVSLVIGELFAFGRRTVSQGLLALGVGGQDWSAWYRLFSLGRFDEEKAGQVMLAESLHHVAASEPYVVGTDGVRIVRSSKTMPGTSWMPGLGMAPFRPGLQRAQRFLHGAWLTPLEEGYSRAIALRFLPAFPEKAVAAANCTVCVGYAPGWTWLGAKSKCCCGWLMRPMMCSIYGVNCQHIACWRCGHRATERCMRCPKKSKGWVVPRPTGIRC